VPLRNPLELFDRNSGAKFLMSAPKPKQREVRSGSWPCKNTLRREAGEKREPVRSQAAIAAISGLVPTMFMTRVRL
jgi:hypothetical protein